MTGTVTPGREGASIPERRGPAGSTPPAGAGVSALPVGSVASRARHAAVAAGLLAVALVLQLFAGAYGPELTVGADDPSHFISGLLVRDYLAHGLGAHPVEFARDYYAHYPKVAIGNWPPLFHAVEGIWLIVLPDRGATVFVLLAVMAAATAWLVHRTLLPLLGAPFALFGAVVFLVLRPVPEYLSSVMAEVPLTLACTLAALAWARLLERADARRVATFAALLLLAILTKANGLLLLLVPPLSIVISGRWQVVRSRALWRAALVAALVVVPWLWWSLPIMREGWAARDALLGDVGEATGYYTRRLLYRIGYVPIALVLVGAWARLRHRAAGDEGGRSALWSTAAAMVLATLLFHFAAPAGEDARHLLPAYPFLAMFMAAGVHALAVALRGPLRSATASSAAALVAGGAAVALASFPVRDLHLRGFGPAAELVLERHAERHGARRTADGGAAAPVPDTVVAFVSSDAVGEGAMAVEMALRDEARPSHVVWRATKLLSTVTWAGREYVQRPEDEAALVRLLDLASVEWVVVDRTREPFPHQRLLERAIEAHPDRFALLGVIPVVRNRERYPDGIRVYDFARDITAPADSLLRQVPGYRGIE